MAANCLNFPFIDGCKNLPKDKDDDVREIREWLETQLQLPKFNDEFLHLFLHCNYYNIEETKSNIKAYFSLRSSSPELFCNRSLSSAKIRIALDNQLFALAPKRTPEGYQVVYIALNEKKLRYFVHQDSIKMTFMLFDLMISECGLCPGYIIVFDSKAFTLQIFLKMHFGSIMKLARYFQEAAPVRVINVITINSVSFVDKLMSVCRPFLRSSLIQKLQFYATGSDLTNFYKIVPRECAFEEYGGTAGSLEAGHEKFVKLLETKYSKWVEDESICEVPKNEVKRSFFSFW